MRFTATVDREAKIFKNTRGTLLGWSLTEQDAETVAGSSDHPEMVLPNFPESLHIEVHTPMSDGTVQRIVYELKRSTVIWARDKARKAKVQRTGFTVVPDFSGTAHSFTGSFFWSFYIES